MHGGPTHSAREGERFLGHGEIPPRSYASPRARASGNANTINHIVVCYASPRARASGQIKRRRAQGGCYASPRARASDALTVLLLSSGSPLLPCKGKRLGRMAATKAERLPSPAQGQASLSALSRRQLLAPVRLSARRNRRLRRTPSPPRRVGTSRRRDDRCSVWQIPARQTSRGRKEMASVRLQPPVRIAA